MKEDPHRGLFACVMLSEPEGILFDDKGKIRARFLEEDDQNSYDKLMQMAQGNLLRHEERKRQITWPGVAT